jgi:hypothetical protein
MDVRVFGTVIPVSKKTTLYFVNISKKRNVENNLESTGSHYPTGGPSFSLWLTLTCTHRGFETVLDLKKQDLGLEDWHAIESWQKV